MQATLNYFNYKAKIYMDGGFCCHDCHESIILTSVSQLSSHASISYPNIFNASNPGVSLLNDTHKIILGYYPCSSVLKFLKPIPQDVPHLTAIFKCTCSYWDSAHL
jgi:hypothetical protein